jgi:hypothetical protein
MPKPLEEESGPGRKAIQSSGGESVVDGTNHLENRHLRSTDERKSKQSLQVCQSLMRDLLFPEDLLQSRSNTKVMKMTMAAATMRALKAGRVTFVPKTGPSDQLVQKPVCTALSPHSFIVEAIWPLLSLT